MENKQKRVDEIHFWKSKGFESLGNNKKKSEKKSFWTLYWFHMPCQASMEKIRLVFTHNCLVQFMHEKLLNYLHFSGSVLLSSFYSKRL